MTNRKYLEKLNDYKYACIMLDLVAEYINRSINKELNVNEAYYYIIKEMSEWLGKERV